MDPETKQRFDGLESAMIRLAEGLQQTHDQMASGFAQTNAAITRLADAQERTEEKMGTLAERVDRLAQLMIRGFDKVSTRQIEAEDRLDKLEGP